MDLTKILYYCLCLATWLESTLERQTLLWRMPTRPPQQGDGPAPIERLPIPQVVAVNDVSERSLLPVVPVSCRRPRNFPPGALDLPWKSPPIACSARSPAITAPRCRAGWSARPRAGSRTKASTGDRRSCPGVRPKMFRGSRRSTRHPPFSSTFAMPGTRESPARRRPSGSRTRKSS